MHEKKNLSSGIVPVHWDGTQWKFLVLRVYSHWDFPKGMVELNEDPWDAAVRELAEETSLSEVHTRWNKIYIETEPYAKAKTARYYLAEIIHPEKVKIIPNPVHGRVEHHEFKWLTYSEARLLFVPRLQRVIDWAQKQL
jgi:8-oxo-dGTP pyrophosphatase MutT (NUDIX family)